MALDMNSIAAGLGTLILSVIAWFGGRATKKATTEATVAKARMEGASAIAETSVVDLLRQEVERLSLRVTAMESREGRLIRHVYRLEGLMRGAGIEPPPFDVDGHTITPGGTD